MFGEFAGRDKRFSVSSVFATKELGTGL